jgi:hypothetical protein
MALTDQKSIWWEFIDRGGFVVLDDFDGRLSRFGHARRDFIALSQDRD